MNTVKKKITRNRVQADQVAKLLDRNRKQTISALKARELPVAVAVRQPEGVALVALEVLGWDGRAEVFGVPNAEALQLLGDINAVIRVWLTRVRVKSVPVFLVSGTGTLLLNLIMQGDGTMLIEPEPGSLAEDPN